MTVSPATATFSPSGEKLVTSRLICQLSPVQLTFSEEAKAEEEEEEEGEKEEEGGGRGRAEGEDCE